MLSESSQRILDYICNMSERVLDYEKMLPGVSERVSYYNHILKIVLKCCRLSENYVNFFERKKNVLVCLKTV